MILVVGVLAVTAFVLAVWSVTCLRVVNERTSELSGRLAALEKDLRG